MPTQSETDLRILAEMADEIEKYGFTQLPGSLRSLVKTQRGRAVAKVLESVAGKALEWKFTASRIEDQLTKAIDGLRNENQNLTELVENLEDRLTDS